MTVFTTFIASSSTTSKISNVYCRISYKGTCKFYFAEVSLRSSQDYQLKKTVHKYMMLYTSNGNFFSLIRNSVVNVLNMPGHGESVGQVSRNRDIP